MVLITAFYSTLLAFTYSTEAFPMDRWSPAAATYMNETEPPTETNNSTYTYLHTRDNNNLCSNVAINDLMAMTNLINQVKVYILRVFSIDLLLSDLNRTMLLSTGVVIGIQ